MDSVSSAARKLLASLRSPVVTPASSKRIALLAVSAVVIAWFLVARTWLRNETTDISISGFFSVSDSADYVRCAEFLLDAGRSREEWCDRRPIYSVLLAGISALSGRAMLPTLLAQAGIVALCALAFSRSVSRHFGLAASWVAFFLLLIYAKVVAFNLTMTEAAGIAFGALAIPFLLRGAMLWNVGSLAIGAALLSIAVTARAGTILMLPALAAWTGAMVLWPQRKRGWALWIVLVAILMGPALQIACGWATGGNVSNAQGNFSYTLYGLATGGRGWHSAMQDHPGLASLPEAVATKQTYALALEQLRDHPSVIARALFRELGTYLERPLFHFPGDILHGAPNALWWIGLIAICIRWRQPAYSLIGALSLGVIFSAPVIIQDGGMRVFAGGFAIACLQAALGAKLLFDAAFHLFGGRKAKPSENDGALPVAQSVDVLAVALLILLCVLFVYPLTPLRRLSAMTEVPAIQCPAGMFPVAARPGFESHYIAIVPQAGSMDVFKMRVSRDKLARRLDRNAWFSADVLALEAPISLMRARWVPPGSDPQELPVYWRGDMSEFRYDAVKACVDRSRSITLGGGPMFLAESVERLIK